MLNNQSTIDKPSLGNTPRVSDMMTEEVFTLSENDSFSLVDTMMKWRRVRHVPIVNEFGDLAGLVTHRDLLKVAISCLAEVDAVEVKKAFDRVRVKDIMQTRVFSVSPHTTMSDAAEVITENKIGCLPVVDKGKLVGIITEADFVQSYCDWEVMFKD